LGHIVQNVELDDKIQALSLMFRQFGSDLEYKLTIKLINRETAVELETA